MVDSLLAYSVPIRYSLFRTSISQITIVSLMALCFWSRSPPSRIVRLPGMWLIFWPSSSSCSSSQSGVVYVRNRSAWRFQSSILPFGQYLMSACVSLYLYWAIHPRVENISVSFLGMASCDRGG